MPPTRMLVKRIFKGMNDLFARYREKVSEEKKQTTVNGHSRCLPNLSFLVGY